MPPIHVLVFPSQVPQDLRLGVRGLYFDIQVRKFSEVIPLFFSTCRIQDGDEAAEHMNLLSVSQALDHVCFSLIYVTRMIIDVYIAAGHKSMA